MYRTATGVSPMVIRSRRAVSHALSLCLASAALLIPSATVCAHEAHENEAHENSLHFSHPLITESPSPDTKVRLDTFFFDQDGEQTTTFRLEAEYAFHPSFSIEVDVPLTRIEADGGGGSVSNLDTIGVGFKFANDAFAAHGVLLTYGLELGLPTGDDRKGIGSGHELEIAPFFAVGYKTGRWELVSFLEFAIPTNQARGQDLGPSPGPDPGTAVLASTLRDGSKRAQSEGEGASEEGEIETELGWTLSALYWFSPRVQGLLELDLATVLSGDETGNGVLNLSPGVKFKPWAKSPWWLGASLGFPVSNQEEFNVRALVSGFYHF